MDMLVKQEKKTLGPANHNLSQGAQAGLGQAWGQQVAAPACSFASAAGKEGKRRLNFPFSTLKHDVCVETAWWRSFGSMLWQSCVCRRDIWHRLEAWAEFYLPLIHAGRFRRLNNIYFFIYFRPYPNTMRGCLFSCIC